MTATRIRMKTILISADLVRNAGRVLEEGASSRPTSSGAARRSIAGNMYMAGWTTCCRGMEAAFIDVGLPKNGFLHVDDVVLPGWTTGSAARRRSTSCSRTARSLLVQVVKDPMGTKGARVTMELSLAGRFLV